MNIAFRVADEQGLALLDLEDLQAMLVWLGENAEEVSRTYGNVAAASIGGIQRALLVLENQGAEDFLGEPALELADLIATGPDGMGRVNVLMSDRLMQSPRLYAMFLLWLLSELFEQLPEVGDPDKPVLVFFFDEAHLLFTDAPKALVDKVVQVVRLIRSKGVGVYFCTQNPDDVPEDVLAQLGNRIQHALQGLHAARRQGAEAGGRDLPPQPGVRHRDGDPRGRHRRGGGVAPRGEGGAGHGQPHADPPAASRAWGRSPPRSGPRRSPPRRSPASTRRRSTGSRRRRSSATAPRRRPRRRRWPRRC